MDGYIARFLVIARSVSSGGLGHRFGFAGGGGPGLLLGHRIDVRRRVLRHGHGGAAVLKVGPGLDQTCVKSWASDHDWTIGENRGIVMCANLICADHSGSGGPE
jgi:hypothetical protein